MADYKYRGNQPWTPNTEEEPGPKGWDRRKGAEQVKPCGTPAAWRRHKKYGEPVDDACLQAKHAENRRHYATSKAKKKAEKQ